MLILALIAIAVLLGAFFPIVRMLLGPRDKEQSLSELECEMMALDAEYARAVQGAAKESNILKQASQSPG
jgi:hypothetical protein